MSRLFSVGNPSKWKAKNIGHAGRQNGFGQAARLWVPRNIQIREIVVHGKELA